MRKSKLSETQIVAMLKEQEAGVPTADLCRKYAISPASFYKYKAKFGGLDVSDAKKLKALEAENAKLKKLLAETMLDVAMLRDVNSKKHVLGLIGDGNARRQTRCGGSSANRA